MTATTATPRALAVDSSRAEVEQHAQAVSATGGQSPPANLPRPAGGRSCTLGGRARRGNFPAALFGPSATRVHARSTARLSSDNLRPSERGARVESITSSILARPTAASAAPQGTSGPDPVWRRADDDLWVATVDGEYGGLVTRLPDGFHVHDRYSRPIGVAATLAAATRLHPPQAGTPRAHRAPSTTSAPGRARRPGPKFAGPSHQREKTT
jgi:hypothetical protein